MALEMGHKVTCLARKSERIPRSDGVQVVEGNPANATDLEKALIGCDAVISVLNISRTSDFPWAPLRTPKHYLSEVMQLLIPLAEKQGIQRIAVCSAWGVLETKADIPFWFRWFINNSNIGVAYADHERQEELLAASPLRWTIVRPVGLSNFRKSETVRESFQNQPRPSLMISRKALANYLVTSLEKDPLIGKRVVVSKG